jgi:superfamily II DNA or RNA helicase
MARTMKIYLPPVYAIDLKLNGNTIRQFIQPGAVVEARVEVIPKGWRIVPEDAEPIIALKSGGKSPDGAGNVIRVRKTAHFMDNELLQDLSSATWIIHPNLPDDPNTAPNSRASVQAALHSWHDCFSYRKDQPERGIKGLRAPQIGAVHAIHAHWSAHEDPGIVVMPTGTGKTETMLSVLVSQGCDRVLVTVPTDPLRKQIARKFLELGLLRSINVLVKTAQYPVVGILESIPKSVEAVDEFFEQCNVVITTMNIPAMSPPEVQERMAHHCPYLFVDEAHHSEAPTWKAFIERFSSQRVLLFTATPFRNDEKPVSGKMIYDYPLKKAQEDGYFKKIRFEPVLEFDPQRSDAAIAERAVRQLRQDIAAGFNHVLLARVATQERAKDVFALYEQYADLNPVRIDSSVSVSEREGIRQKILRLEAKIIVCVDMLGEGFDLPELKVAALHDVRKSLAITIQLAGRFTRTKEGLGDPTFFANLADHNLQDELRKFYALGADWNILLRDSSEEAIEEQKQFWRYVEGFSNLPNELPVQNLRPAMSAAIYRTTCEEWTPQHFHKGIKGIKNFEHVYHDVNSDDDTLVIIMGKRVPIDWVAVEDIFNWDWELLILYWDREQKLLFINSSSNDGYFKDLAEAVCDGVDLVWGPPIFRVFHGINRLRLNNVGLLKQLGRLIRYSGNMGANVALALSPGQIHNTKKAIVDGVGYEDGARTTLGCTYKGRVWSKRTTNLAQLVGWCRRIGAKVLDDSIDADAILRGTLTSEPVGTRPNKMPIAVDWPDEIYRQSETVYCVVLADGTELPLWQSDILLVDPSKDGPLKFEVRSGDVAVNLELVLEVHGEQPVYRFRQEGQQAFMRRGRNHTEPLEDFLFHAPPCVWFADGSSLEGNEFTELKRSYEPYQRDKIDAWDWAGVNIKKESQKREKRSGTIQYHVIEKLKTRDYELIFDDDSSGEAADVVAVKSSSQAVNIEFYHCKFSGGEAPGARSDDLYTVCGQAQKSVRWIEEPSELFNHLLRRHQDWMTTYGTTRIEVGDENLLITLREKCTLLPVELKIFVVQPGLSKEGAEEDQLRLLSVVENYLIETYQLAFGVIVSE